jgi:phospholipid/cholesterol/gamma-HCH transport system substrate-binding protein
LDWDYAVLSAATGGSPTDTIGQVAQQVQESVLPAIEELKRAAAAAATMIEALNAQDSAFQRGLSDFAAVAAGLRQGEGTVGHLLTDDKLIRELEATAASARRQIDAAKVGQLTTELEKTIVGVNGLLGEVRRTMPDVAAVAKNSATASVALPATLMQVDRTLVELDLLLRQLRRSWLIGGGNEPRQPEELPRLSPIEARP